MTNEAIRYPTAADYEMLFEKDNFVGKIRKAFWRLIRAVRSLRTTPGGRRSACWYSVRSRIA